MQVARDPTPASTAPGCSSVGSLGNSHSTFGKHFSSYRTNIFSQSLVQAAVKCISDKLDYYRSLDSLCCDHAFFNLLTINAKLS